MKNSTALKLLQISKSLDDFIANNTANTVRKPAKIDAFLADDSESDFKIPNPRNLRAVMEGVYVAYRYRANLLRELGKDYKNLPFIVHDVKEYNILNYIFDAIGNVDLNLIKTKRILKNEVFAYFLFFDTSRQTELLRKDILKKFENCDLRNKKLLQWKGNKYLFGNDSIEHSCNIVKSMDFLEYFRTIGFTDSLMTSNYVKVVLEDFFKNGQLKYKMNLFRDLYGSNSEKSKRDIYRVKLPDILSVLIKEVDQYEGAEKQEYMDEIKNTAYDLLGDPRIKDQKLYQQWNRVDSKAKEIFIKWVSQYDLDLFFKIIDSTALDRMWRYRKAFWKAYIPYMKRTWIAFGFTSEMKAKLISKGQPLYHGRLKDGVSNNQSCFICEIGNLLFIEWSHNGKLRVWNKDECPFKIGDEYIFGNRIRYSKSVIDEWIHSAAVSYSWQKKVAEFIFKHTGVYKDKKDWVEN